MTSPSLRHWHVDKKGKQLPKLQATPSLRNWYVDEKGKKLPKLKSKLLGTRSAKDSAEKSPD